MNHIPVYRVERLTAGRLKDLETLHRAVYGARPAKQLYPRKYNASCTPVSYTGYLAYSPDNTPIAYYGVMPCFIQYKDRLILSAQSGDTMTHPHYRMKGMFVELANLTFELCRTSGIKLVFGFPNQNSYRGLLKLGWEGAETMERFTIPIGRSGPRSILRQPGLLRSLSRRSGLLRSVYNKYTGWMIHRYAVSQQGLSNAVIAEGYGGVYRDPSYLQYRTYNNTQVIRAGNALAWIRIKDGLFIGDLHVEDIDFDEAMHVIRKMASRIGLSSITFQSSPGTHLHTLFAERYRGEPSFPILFKDLGSGLPLQHIKFTFSDIDIF
jgi:hypothetical protein